MKITHKELGNNSAIKEGQKVVLIGIEDIKYLPYYGIIDEMIKSIEYEIRFKDGYGESQLLKGRHENDIFKRIRD